MVKPNQEGKLTSRNILEDQIKKAQFVDRLGRPANLFSTNRDLARKTLPEPRNTRPSSQVAPWAECEKNKRCELKPQLMAREGARMTKQDLAMIPFMGLSSHSSGTRQMRKSSYRTMFSSLEAAPWRKDLASSAGKQRVVHAHQLSEKVG